MAKRFTATEIWDEDWYLDMPVQYKLFWFYMLSTCDHSGIFKVNLGSFCRLNGVKLTGSEALDYFNSGKNRIRVLNQSVWLIEDFFVYQYGPKFNPNNRVHNSIREVWEKYGVKLGSIRGLVEVKLGSNWGQSEVTDGVKEKDKEIDITLDLGIGGTGERDIEEKKDNGVIYDLPEYLKTHRKQMETICMHYHKDENFVLGILQKFHLHQIEHNYYPKKPLQLIAGLCKWILNENKYGNNQPAFAKRNGKHDGAAILRAELERDLAAARAANDSD